MENNPSSTNSETALMTSSEAGDRGIISPLHPRVENASSDRSNENTMRTSESEIPGIEVTKSGHENESSNLIPSNPDGERRTELDEDPHGYHRPYSPYPASERPHFTTPGYGFANEIGSTLGGTEIPDVNIYQHKKTLAQGMMDLALFSANANQLRYVLESFARHPFYYPSVVLISMSLILQVVIGVGLVWNATYNVKDEKEICVANKINNFTVIGIFLVTVINVFISAFGVADPA